MASRLITARDVAARLGVAVPTFQRRRQEMEAAGFPPPCPPFKNRWSENQVDQFIASGGVKSTPAITAAPPANDGGQDWAKTLKERARA